MTHAGVGRRVAPDAVAVRDLMWQHAGLVRVARPASKRAVTRLARVARHDRGRCAAPHRRNRERAPSRQPGDRRLADRARRAAPRREPRRPLPRGFPAARRYTLAETRARTCCARDNTQLSTPDSQLPSPNGSPIAGLGVGSRALEVDRNPCRKRPRSPTFQPKSRPSPRTSAAGTSTSSAAPSWPTIRRSRAAW